MRAEVRSIEGLFWVMLSIIAALTLVVPMVGPAVASGDTLFISSVTAREVALNTSKTSSMIYYWPAAFVFAVFSILSLITFARTSRLIMAILAMIFTAITYALTKLAGG